MPPVVIGAGIAAIGSLAASKMASSSSNKATKAQSDANNQALAFQKQQDTMGRADWDKAMRAWEANRNQLLQRYGISIPTAPAQVPQPGAIPRGQPMQPGPAQMWQGGQGQMPPGGDNLAALIGRGGYTGAPNRYGLG